MDHSNSYILLRKIITEMIRVSKISNTNETILGIYPLCYNNNNNKTIILAPMTITTTSGEKRYQEIIPKRLKSIR